MTAMMLYFAAGGAAGLAIGLLIGRRCRRRKKSASTTDSFLRLLKH